MRIGFFTYGMDGERMTGIARYAVELTRALKRLEPSLDIVLLNPYPASAHPWYREFETYPLPNLALLPAAATLGNWQLHRAAIRLKLDILHDPCGIAPFLVPTNRYKRVTTVCDAIPVTHPETQPLLTRGVFQTLVRAARATSDAVITISRASARDLHDHLGIPYAKLHTTLLATTASPPLSADEITAPQLERLEITRPYLLYVGALHPRKNITRVIAAFRKVRERRPDVTLVIVGPASWGASRVLNEVLGNSSTDTGIRFTGFVSDETLRALYAGAKALVFPSLYEGFGFPVLEAMAAGTPVVTSNLSSLPEVAGEAALLVDPYSIDAIADAVLELLGNDTLHSTLARRGLERAHSFTWERTARETLAVYRNVLGHPATVRSERYAETS